MSFPPEAEQSIVCPHRTAAYPFIPQSYCCVSIHPAIVLLRTHSSRDGVCVSSIRANEPGVTLTLLPSLGAGVMSILNSFFSVELRPDNIEGHGPVLHY